MDGTLEKYIIRPGKIVCCCYFNDMIGFVETNATSHKTVRVMDLTTDGIILEEPITFETLDLC